MLLCFIPNKLQSGCTISALKGKRRIGGFLVQEIGTEVNYMKL